jgi:hypothetical protein
VDSPRPVPLRRLPGIRDNYDDQRSLGVEHLSERGSRQIPRQARSRSRSTFSCGTSLSRNSRHIRRLFTTV